MHSAFIVNTVSVEDASVFSSQTFRFLCIFTHSLVGVFGKGQKIRGSKELLPSQDLGTEGAHQDQDRDAGTVENWLQRILGRPQRTLRIHSLG